MNFHKYLKNCHWISAYFLGCQCGYTCLCGSTTASGMGRE